MGEITGPDLEGCCQVMRVETEVASYLGAKEWMISHRSRLPVVCLCASWGSLFTLFLPLRLSGKTRTLPSRFSRYLTWKWHF